MARWSGRGRDSVIRAIAVLILVGSTPQVSEARQQAGTCAEQSECLRVSFSPCHHHHREVCLHYVDNGRCTKKRHTSHHHSNNRGDSYTPMEGLYSAYAPMHHVCRAGSVTSTITHWQLGGSICQTGEGGQTVTFGVADGAGCNAAAAEQGSYFIPLADNINSGLQMKCSIPMASEAGNDWDSVCCKPGSPLCRDDRGRECAWTIRVPKCDVKEDGPSLAGPDGGRRPHHAHCGMDFCDGREDGLYCNPKDRRSYYSCIRFKSALVICPPGMMYDPALGDDMVDEYLYEEDEPGADGVVIDEEEIDGSLMDPCVMASLSLPQCDETCARGRAPGLDEEWCRDFCKHRPDGVYCNPHDPSSFFVCEEHQKRLRICAHGTVFDPTQDLEDRERFPCSEPHSKIPTCSLGCKPGDGLHDRGHSRGRFLSEPAESLVKCGPEFCEGRADGVYCNPKERHSYYTCTGGKSHIEMCSEGHVFDPSFAQTPAKPDVPDTTDSLREDEDEFDDASDDPCVPLSFSVPKCPLKCVGHGSGDGDAGGHRQDDDRYHGRKGHLPQSGRTRSCHCYHQYSGCLCPQATSMLDVVECVGVDMKPLRPVEDCNYKPPQYKSCSCNSSFVEWAALDGCTGDQMTLRPVCRDQGNGHIIHADAQQRCPWLDLRLERVQECSRLEHPRWALLPTGPYGSCAPANGAARSRTMPLDCVKLMGAGMARVAHNSAEYHSHCEALPRPAGTNQTCRAIPEECPENYCLGRGTCRPDDVHGGWRCDCMAGFSGTNCQSVLSECSLANQVRIDGTCCDSDRLAVANGRAICCPGGAQVVDTESATCCPRSLLHQTPPGCPCRNYTDPEVYRSLPIGDSCCPWSSLWASHPTMAGACCPPWDPGFLKCGVCGDTACNIRLSLKLNCSTTALAGSGPAHLVVVDRVLQEISATTAIPQELMTEVHVVVLESNEKQRKMMRLAGEKSYLLEMSVVVSEGAVGADRSLLLRGLLLTAANTRHNLTKQGVQDIEVGGVTAQPWCRGGRCLGNTENFQPRACPQGHNGMPCSGNGACQQLTGSCMCLPPFQGPSCDECAEGFFSEADDPARCFGPLHPAILTHLRAQHGSASGAPKRQRPPASQGMQGGSERGFRGDAVPSDGGISSSGLRAERPSGSSPLGREAASGPLRRMQNRAARKLLLALAGAAVVVLVVVLTLATTLHLQQRQKSRGDESRQSLLPAGIRPMRKPGGAGKKMSLESIGDGTQPKYGRDIDLAAPPPRSPYTRLVHRTPSRTGPGTAFDQALRSYEQYGPSTTAASTPSSGPGSAWAHRLRSGSTHDTSGHGAGGAPSS